MGSVQIISFERDSAAVAALERHHAGMREALTTHVEAMVAAAAQRNSGDAEAARHELESWCREELLPHVRAEETALYSVAYADPRASLLVEGMLAEHHALSALVDEVAGADDEVQAAAAANALRHVFTIHVAKESEQLLPLLARSPHVSLADRLGGLHDTLDAGPGEQARGTRQGAGAAQDRGHRRGLVSR